MKRIFALALAICMALSMMVLTASANPTPLRCSCGAVIEACTDPDHAGKKHIHIHGITPWNGSTKLTYRKLDFGNQTIIGNYDSSFVIGTSGITPAIGMLICINDNGSSFTLRGVCKNPPHSAATGNCKEVKFISGKNFVCKHDNDISYELQAGNVIRSGCTINATGCNIDLGGSTLSGTNNLLNTDVEVTEVYNPLAYLKLSKIVPHSEAPGVCTRVMGDGAGGFVCYHDGYDQYPLQPCDIIKSGTRFELSGLIAGGAIYVDGTELITLKSIDPTEDTFPWDARVISIKDGVLRCELIKPQPEPQSQPQPKTGVMDTLPVWFGVMAVSACAYVLTSKKKVF